MTLAARFRLNCFTFSRISLLVSMAEDKVPDFLLNINHENSSKAVRICIAQDSITIVMMTMNSTTIIFLITIIFIITIFIIIIIVVVAATTTTTTTLQIVFSSKIFEGMTKKGHKKFWCAVVLSGELLKKSSEILVY